MRAFVLRVALVALLGLAADHGKISTGGQTDADTRALGMTPAVACASINGLEDYVPLDEPAVTRDDKLLVYFEPRNYRTEKAGTEYRAFLTVDARLRKRADKRVLRKKDDIVKYQPKSRAPLGRIYLSATIELKPYEPGEYDLDIILHDKLAKGSPATQTLAFRILSSARQDCEQ
jgi:hypothetical protein